MKLIILTAVLAVCGAAKLEKRFILPGSARIGGSGLTGGSAHIGGSVARPATSAVGLFGRVLTNDVPSGGYTNDAQGVVVDAVAPGTRTSGVEPTGLGGPRTAYGSVNSKVGEAAFEFGGTANEAPLFGLGAAGDGASRVGFGVGSAAVKGGNVGGLGTGVSPGAASISTDGSGFGSAAFKEGNAGGLGIGASSGAASISTDGSGLGSAATKGGNAGSLGIGVSPGAGSISTDGSGFGSASLKGGNAGSLGIGGSPGGASISTDGFGLGSNALKGGNAGSLGIGVSPGAGSISTDGSGFGSSALKGGNAGSLGIGGSPGGASISTDGSGFGSAALKGGNAGSLGIGGSPGGASISTDGFGLGSNALKGGNAGSFGIGVSPGASSISTDGLGFGTAAVKGGNAGSFGIGISPGAGSISTKDNSDIAAAAVKGGNAGSLGIGVSPGAGSISTDGSGFGSAALKEGNAGSLGIGGSPGGASISTDGSGFGSAALKGGNAGSLGIGGSPGGASISTDGSGFGSAALKGGNAGSLGIGGSPGGASISTDGFGLGSNALKGGNAGSFGIGVSPGASSISTDGLGFGTAAVKGGNAGSFGIGISPGAGSISTKDNSGIASAAVKGGNAGSLGIGVSPGAGSISTDGSGFGSAALKGGNAGSLGIGGSPGGASISTDGFGLGSNALKGGNAGSFGIGVSPGASSISTDGLGFGTAAVKDENAGSFGIGVSSGAGSISTDGSGFGSAAVKGGNAGSFGIGISPGAGSISTKDSSGIASAAVKGGNAGSFGFDVSPDAVSSGAGSISTDGSGLGSAALKGGNAGGLGIGISSGAGSISTDSSGFGSAALKGGNPGSFGIGASPGTASISADGIGFGSDTIKGGNAGSLGIGVLPGAGSFSTDGFGFGSTAVKGAKVGGLGIGSTSGTDSVHTGHEDDKDYALKFANSFGLNKYSFGFETDNGISVGARGDSADGIKANGEYSYKGDDGKEYSVKYTADKNGYRPIGSHLPTPPPIPDEILESLKQNAKEEAAGIVDDGTYNAQKYKDEGDTSNNGETASIGGSLANQAIKSNAAIQSTGSVTGSVGVQGSYGHTQGFGGQIFDNKNIEFGSSQGEQEIVGQGLLGVKPRLGIQTTTSHESVFEKTERFGVQTNKNVKPNSSGSTVSAIASTGNQGIIGVPTLEGSFKDSSNDNSAYSSATVTSSGSASAFATTGKIDAATQPFLKLVDKRPKLPNQPSKDISSSTSSAEVGTLGGSLHTNFPAQTSINTDSNSATVGSSLSSATSSYNDDTTQASLSSFSSLLPSLSSNFGKLSSSQSQQSTKVSQSTNDQKVSVSSGAQSNIQQGTVYEYSKPTTSLSSEGHDISSQVNSETQTSQTLFGTQHSLNKPSQTQYSQKTFDSSQSGSKLQQSGANSFPQNQGSIYEYNKPATSLTFSKDTKYSGVSQGTGSSFLQTQYGSTPESLFGQKQQTTGSLSQTSTFGQKPVGDSQTSTTYEKTQFSSLSSNGASKGQSGQSTQFSLKPFGSTLSTGSSFPETQFGSTSEKTQFGSLSSSGTSKGHYGSTTQFGVKPFGSTLNTGSSFSQSKFGSTFGSQNNQKSQQGVATISTTFPHVTPISQYGKQPFGVQSNFGSFQQSQHYSSTTGSKFVQQPQVTGTVFVQKPTGISQTNFDYKNNQFGSLSSPSLSVKPQSTLGSSFSTSSASKEASAQTGQFGVKPFGSSQSQLGISGSLFGKKEQTTGTLSQTSTTIGQKPVGISQTITTHDKTHFGSLTGTLFNEKSQTSQGGSFSSSDATKGQSGVTTQFGVKPFGSTWNTGSSFSQTQFSSASESQKDHKSQLGVATVSTTFPHVTPISQYGKKPYGTQSTTFGSFQQTQHYAGQKPQTTSTLSQTFGDKSVGVSLTGTTSEKTQFGSSSSSLLNEKLQSTKGSSLSSSGSFKGQSVLTTQFGSKPFGSKLSTGSSSSQTQVDSTSGSLFGQKPQATGLLSLTSTTSGQKPIGVSQSSSTFEKTQFGSSSGSLYNEKSQGNSFSSNDASKGQSGLTTQFGVKPTLSTGYGFSQTQFGTESGSHNDKKSQFGFGTISTATPQVVPISQYNKKPFGFQSTQNDFQQSQYSGSAGSQFGQNAQTGGSYSLFTIVGQKPTPLMGEKLQITQGGSLFSTGTSKVQSDLTNKFGPATFNSSPSTGSSSTQTQFDSTLTSQSVKKPISSLSSQDLLQGSFGGIQTSQVSKYQSSQFSTSGVQPIGSILSQVIEQQKTQTSNQIGEQKPFGGFESSYQQAGIQKPAVIQISQPFEFKAQHSNNNNLYTVSSSSNIYPSSEIHVYREQNVQGVSEPRKVVSGSKTTFSKVEKKVNFQGPGEIFAGIREPPKFDIKTGYHY